MTTIPTSSATTTVRGFSRRPLFGSVKPSASNSSNSPFASAKPSHEPDDRGEHAGHRRLDEHAPEHLPARRADRPQGRELARPLRDRDRDRVRDHERADEERHSAEREQERLQERENDFVSLGVRGGLRLAGLHLRVRRQDRADLAEQRRLGDSRLRRDPDLVELALLAEEPLRGLQVETGERGAADDAAAPKFTSPETRNGSARPCPCTPIVMPTLMCFFDAVEPSITTSLALRPVPLHERERVEARLGGIDREAEVGGAAERDHLAVRADQLGLAADAADRGRNARQRAAPWGAATRRTTAPRSPPRSTR